MHGTGSRITRHACTHESALNDNKLSWRDEDGVRIDRCPPHTGWLPGYSDVKCNIVTHWVRLSASLAWLPTPLGVSIDRGV